MHDVSLMTPDEIRKLADEIEAHNERKRVNDAAGWLKIFDPRPPPFDFSTMSVEDIRGLLTRIEQVAAIR